MNSWIQFTTPTRPLVMAVIVLCLGAAGPQAPAVSPAPDGGYPGNNTAEGTSALFSLTSGIDNTALGFNASIETRAEITTPRPDSGRCSTTRPGDKTRPTV